MSHVAGSLSGEGLLTAVNFASTYRYSTTWNVEPESDLKYVRKYVEIVEDSYMTVVIFSPKLSGIDFRRVVFTVSL